MNEFGSPFEIDGPLESFNHYFELSSQAQAKALELMDTAIEKRKEHPEKTVYQQSTGQDVNNPKWEEDKRTLADELAKAIDPDFVPRMGGNKDETTIQRVHFINMLSTHSAEELEEARDKLQEISINRD